MHAIVFSPEAEKVRGFFADVLGLSSVDAGGGWPIFALPPAELAVHPDGSSRQQLYLMCDDIRATLAELEARGAQVTSDGRLRTRSSRSLAKSAYSVSRRFGSCASLI